MADLAKKAAFPAILYFRTQRRRKFRTSLFAIFMQMSRRKSLQKRFCKKLTGFKMLVRFCPIRLQQAPGIHQFSSIHYIV